MDLTCRFSKVKNNRLLNRVQLIVDVLHDREAKVTKEQIREKLRAVFKSNILSYFKLKSISEEEEQEELHLYMIMKNLLKK